MSLDLSKVIHNVTIDNKPVAIYNKSDTLSPYLLPARKLSITSEVYGSRLYEYLYAQDLSLEEVNIYPSYIYFSAFYGCDKLKKATFQASNLTVTDGAFANCQSLKEIYIPEATVVNCAVSAGGSGTFYGSPIETFSAPKLISLSGSAPFENTKLSNIYLPECTTLGSSVFSHSPLKELTLNNFPKLETVGSTCFYGCDLETVDTNITTLGYNTFGDCKLLKSVNIPNAVTIPTLAFVNCSALESVTMQNATGLGASAFKGCENLKYISIPNCSTLEGGVFSGCNNLTSIDIPNCSQISAGYQFAGCYRLSQVNIPLLPSVTNGMFSSCFGLESVNFPLCQAVSTYAFWTAGVSTVNLPMCSYVGSSAFYGCRLLRDINIQDCAILNDLALCSCINLTKISLPNCLQLKRDVFSGCNKLSAVIFAGSNVVSVINSAAAWNMFVGTPIRSSGYLGYFGSIYVPTSLISNYISVFGSSLSSRITSIENWVEG